MKTTLRFLFLAFVLAVSGVHAADTEAVNQARKSANSWLALVDAAQYGQSWDEAATLFKSAVTKQEWMKAVQSTRAPLGALKSRTFKTATFTRSLPGAPDGEYVVIQFDTRFENKAAAVETVTPMRQKDGAWKVSGYYIR
ncbi:DUF4019 domain-containing protein [Candidatus Competibacter phosphatis]|uniref:DUF4019 domain-containing protein n=1 Tax=Candidatus Competibacter phosphatis TaxID=221280 RepID=A0ABX1TJJ3_9GAMM|nr:DUF4019 domain-containing protein [Candidatus Competibacter phosphatis]NMQ19556.1 DUF4019 domain-containing protein [Candidatus Competibacter phosphatis]